MKRTGLVLFFLVLFYSVSLYAYPTVNSGSGLLKMRTADVAPSGTLDVNLSGIFDSYRIPQSYNYDSDGMVQMGFTLGLWNLMEVGLLAPPYMFYSDSSVEGWRNMQTMMKIRLLGSREKGYGVALTGFADLDSSNTINKLNSGKPGYGYEMNISFFGDVTSLHLNVGWEKTDTKYLVPRFDYKSERKVTGAVGVEIRALPELLLSAEAIGYYAHDSKDKNVLIVPGVRYSPNDFLTLSFGMGFGVPVDSSDPENEYLAGLTFRFGGPARVRTAGARMNEMESRNLAMEENIQKLEKDVDLRLNNFEVALRGGLGQGTPVAAARTFPSDQAKTREEIIQLENRVSVLERGSACRTPAASESGGEKNNGERPRIEIVNGTSHKGLAKLLADRLKRRGYNIVRVRQDAGLRQRSSTIYYREGYAENAVTAGHMIPKDQYVFGKSDIDEDIDIQIVIGSDLSDLE